MVIPIGFRRELFHVKNKGDDYTLLKWVNRNELYTFWGLQMEQGINPHTLWIDIYLNMYVLSLCVDTDI